MASIDASRTEESPPLRAFTEAFFDAAIAKVRKKLTGQDRALDQIFSHLKSWYLTPPEERLGITIVTVVGMTATGKTTAIMEAVKELDLLSQTFYMHVEKFAAANVRPDEFGQELFRAVESEDTVEGLNITGMRKLENPVIFLDEMQKLNTRDDGKNVDRPNANQIFEFLGNNGLLRIPNPAYSEIKSAIGRPWWHASVPEEIREDKAKRKQFFDAFSLQMKDLLAKTPPQVELDFSSGIIFIGMNLDNVFEGARASNPEAYSANELHRITSDVTPTKIRGGLLQLFRPEHVRRLGSRFVSFATFSEAEFREQQGKEIAKIEELARKKYKFTLRFSPAVMERIYQEGAIPSQGMVPLVDTAKAFAKDPLTTVHARLKSLGYDNVPVLIDVALDPKSPSHTVWTLIEGERILDTMNFLIPNEDFLSRQLREEPLRSHVAVRLAARVTAGIVCFNELPHLVRANSRVAGKDGIVDFSKDRPTPDYKLRPEILKQIDYHLAAYVMEHLIFGDASAMSESDLSAASAWANHLVKNGMSVDGADFTANLYSRGQASTLFERTFVHRDPSYMLFSGKERDGIPQDIERVLRLRFHAVRQSLQDHRNFIGKLAKRLTETVELDSQALREIFDAEWEGDKSFLQSSNSPSAARQFIDDPSGFEFKADPGPPPLVIDRRYLQRP